MSYKQSLKERIEFALDKERRRIMMLLLGVLFLLVATEGLMGEDGFLVLKILGAILAILILNLVSEKSCGIAMAATCPLVFIYTIIVWGNTVLGF